MAKEYTPEQKARFADMDKAAEAYEAELAKIVVQYPEAMRMMAELTTRYRMTAGYQRMIQKLWAQFE